MMTHLLYEHIVVYIGENSACLRKADDRKTYTHRQWKFVDESSGYECLKELIHSERYRFSFEYNIIHSYKYEAKTVRQTFILYTIESLMTRK